MEIVCSVVGKIVELTVESVGRQLSYLCFLTDNLQKLKSHVEMLKESRETVQRMVNDARRNVEDIKPIVQNWLIKVDAMIERSELIITNEGQQIRFCLNLVQHHQLSRKAVKMAKEILEMKNEGNFDRVSYNVAKYESSLIKNSYFFHFESRRSVKEQIIEALVDDNIKKVGIYGMGGIGKTTLVKEISREVMEKKLFDEVVVSTISQTPDLKRIQGELAEKLGLIFEEHTAEGRALKLHKRLKIGKKSLIVFDDIWTPIDLEAIGIPSEVDDKECKILFTSRDKHTLSNDMCINNNFELRVLQKDEAWDLFKTNVGEMIETFDLKPIAIQIVRECANLPIAILTVAKALRNKHISIWIDTLNQLRNPEVVNIRGMSEKVYASLKLSYDQLECEEAKMLFLLCSMFPEDFAIDMRQMHIYVMAFELLHGVDTVAQGRNKIIKLVDDLISSSLLLKCTDDNHDYVKMHDLVRDVAILLASKNDQIRTLSYVKYSNEWKVDEVSGSQTAMYLDIIYCESPPQKLMLPKAQLLMLLGRWSLVQKLPINFFEEMKELKVLELKCLKCSLLPPSLHSLSNLRSLCLLDSKLENIDMIGQLNKLEILSLKGSNITQIPMTVNQLTELKVLDLSFCRKLEVIPPNVISRLTKLEELNLETYEGWEREELNKERKNASLFELKKLTGLSTLHLRIQDEKLMPREMFSMENLETFNITIGCPQNFFYHHGVIVRKKLHLKMESKGCMINGIKMLLQRSEELHLEGLFGANVFLFGFDENEFSHVRYLDLLNIYGLQYVIHEQIQPFRKSLSNLVHICLRGLKNLECIIHGYDRKYPFNKLKFIEVKECKKLGSLFINSILSDVSNLVSIEIGDCEMMETIAVMETKEATDKFEFTHLKTLNLYCLPQLKSFFSEMEKDDFSNNDSFFCEEVSLPNLEKLLIRKLDNLKMICGNVLIPNSFSKLKEVNIFSCNNLEKVFSREIMSILSCLECIWIHNCNLLEGIFEMQESNVTKGNVALLPQLRELKLSKLPSLRYVWSEDPYELQVFENMETLSIHQCPKLSKECIIKVPPQLKRLDTELSGMEEILAKERSMGKSKLHQFNTSKLKSLQLLGCLDYNLSHLPIEMVQILPCLEKFEVENALIEEIFPNDRLISVKEHQCALRSLYLHKLPKVKHLWKEGSHNNTSVLLQQLKYLCISECGISNILVPSSASFRNLTKLHVRNCHRLIHLLNPSVARTLVQLESLEIRGCRMMKTVIDVGGVEEENDKIVFNRLQHLLLSNIPKLTSFHSGRCIIKLPCLSSLEIGACPEMTVFSFGTVSTPHLIDRRFKFLVDSFNLVPGREFYGMLVEDINVKIRQCLELSPNTYISNLFTEENSEEAKYDHSTSFVEE